MRWQARACVSLGGGSELPLMLLMGSLWAVGKGGTNWGPNTLNMNNTTERGTSSEEPWDEAATSRLLNETIRILEETTGDKLPVP